MGGWVDGWFWGRGVLNILRNFFEGFDWVILGGFFHRYFGFFFKFECVVLGVLEDSGIFGKIPNRRKYRKQKK